MRLHGNVPHRLLFLDGHLWLEFAAPVFADWSVTFAVVSHRLSAVAGLGAQQFVHNMQGLLGRLVLFRKSASVRSDLVRRKVPYACPSATKTSLFPPLHQHSSWHMPFIEMSQPRLDCFRNDVVSTQFANSVVPIGVRKFCRTIVNKPPEMRVSKNLSLCDLPDDLQEKLFLNS